jgi:hypothetical protein
MGNRLRRLGRPLIIAAALAGMIAPLRTTTPAAAAANRCNSQTVDDAYARVRDYSRRGTGGSTTQQVQRFASVAGVLATLRDEREILDSVCTSDASRAPLFAEIAATTAWALTLEAALAAKLNASCPAAAQALPTMMLSDAWLAMARVVNDSGGTVPALFGNVIAQVQAGAQGVGLTLPPWADTSQYWRDQVHTKARAEAATCPSPSPSPSG